MTVWEAMEARHSVRHYTNRPLTEEQITLLQNRIQQLNAKGSVRIQLVLNEPGAFCAEKPHYGSFSGVRNYLVFSGPSDVKEEVGYSGEELVLLAQQIGLNTCWVFLTYEKQFAKSFLNRGEHLHMVISIGYGETQGTPHRGKTAKEVCPEYDTMPDWFRKGIDAVLLAPTAINQQRFRFQLLEGNLVKATAPAGICTSYDLGIAKYHFAVGAEGTEFRFC